VLSPDYILHILKTECGYHDGDSIVVGVSGGADSVALLHLLHAAKAPVAAAHVNYGFRGEESDGDEKFVSELCAKLGVPLYTRRTNGEELQTLSNNLQDSARIFRINFMHEICDKESVSFVAFAHHSDDQLETVLMNLMRGSGLRGVAGMRKRSGRIIRPLLKINRAEIEVYLNLSGCNWRNDSTNDGNDYLRNRIRHQVAPAIRMVDERHGKGIHNTLEQLLAQQQLLDQLVQTVFDEAVQIHFGYQTISKKVLERFPQPYLVLNQLLHINEHAHRFTEQSYASFTGGQVGKRIEEHGLHVYNDRDHIALVYDIDSGDYPITIFAGSDHHEWRCESVPVDDTFNFSGTEAVVDPALSGPELIVRQWKPGDKMQPYGFTGTKKVSDILTEMKLPSYLKENYPVVTSNDEIVWIPGYRIADKYKVTPETKTALHIKWNR
jgi:tRNA(Ile)-lysidine synthase